MDDEELLLKFAKQFIEQYDPDIEVESIDSPVKALKKLDEQQYDCIVSDYQMPQMDCIELARRVREFSQVPFIIYTGRGSEEVAEMAFSVGVDDYLRKEHDPAHYQVLTRRIRTAVEKHRVEENLRSSREMYRTLLQESIDAVLVISSSKFVYLNRFATELFGYSDSSELLEKDSSGFIVPEDRERVIENAMARQRGEESPDRYELKLLRRDGDMVDVEAHISLIDYEGKPASLIFCRDITERKKM
ncbi:PAS domain S-box protein, partial [Candidatus Bathyarchaeota archaeon]|nr:PAS domain S-box protein [Candidatus Bathyarchaeota archaeon]